MHHVFVAQKLLIFIAVCICILCCSNAGLYPQALTGLVSMDVTGTVSLILGSSVLAVRVV